MSTPTTARGALLRRAATLLVAAALVGAPAASALADPTTGPSPDVAPSPSASASPTPDASPSTEASPAASPTTSPTDTPSPSFTAPAPSPSATDAATAPAPSASPTTTPSASSSPIALLAAGAEDTAAAAFIARTLADRDDHYVYPGGSYFDGGNTIDAVIALNAVGTEPAQADASLSYLRANLDTYIGSFGEVYAGPVAKALLAAVVAGADPTSFGGHDLVAELQALETTEGRFSDESTYGDYSNTIGQSLAIIALSRAGEGLNAASVQLLLDRQCQDGGFRGDLGGSGACASDADATAFAVQALLVAADTLVCGTDDDGFSAEVSSAAQRGLDRLEDVQNASGGFVSDDGAVNANTTGVAAQALTAGGRTTAADDANAFILTLQYGDSSPEALRGGIAFSADTRSTTVPSDTDLRATPQATLALAHDSLVDVVAPGVEDAAKGDECPPVATRLPVVASATTSPSSTADPTSSDETTDGAGGSDPSTTVGSSATGSLAQTGSDLLLPALLGLLLVVIGGVAVFASTRRRGAHA
jgi:hypothetical protein